MAGCRYGTDGRRTLDPLPKSEILMHRRSAVIPIPGLAFRAGGPRETGPVGIVETNQRPGVGSIHNLAGAVSDGGGEWGVEEVAGAGNQRSGISSSEGEVTAR